jgi:hypothetical protein
VSAVPKRVRPSRSGKKRPRPDDNLPHVSASPSASNKIQRKRPGADGNDKVNRRQEASGRAKVARAPATAAASGATAKGTTKARQIGPVAEHMSAGQSTARQGTAKVVHGRTQEVHPRASTARCQHALSDGAAKAQPTHGKGDVSRRQQRDDSLVDELAAGSGSGRGGKGEGTHGGAGKRRRAKKVADTNALDKMLTKRARHLFGLGDGKGIQSALTVDKQWRA